MIFKPCIECGVPAESRYCPDCQPSLPPKLPAKVRGYDYTWKQLSRRARRLQPFCTDCGSTDDLTTDHTPEAWKRKSEGKTIRLSDVNVVCRSCNSRRGPARGPRGRGADSEAPIPSRKAEFRSHTQGGYR